ncbi:MAG: hypothetical protein QOG23_5883 [Blastocatellia bacterium]|jgi:hypothetical protein|nr:hypothetical protein [Blastocatellia bacterium]
MHPPFRPVSFKSTQYLALVLEAFCPIPYQFGCLACNHAFAVPVQEIIEAARLVEPEFPSLVEGEVI